MQYLPAAISAGLTSIAAVRQATKRNLKLRFQVREYQHTSLSDVHCPLPLEYFGTLTQVYKAAQLTMTSILYTHAVVCSLQLGEFDPDWLVPYKQLGAESLDTPAHQALNVQSARESLVLTQNNGNVLPFTKTGLKVAVVGPSANDSQILLGNYQGIPSRIVTALQGLQAVGGGMGATITYGNGCGVDNATTGSNNAQPCPSSSTFPSALSAAAGSDVIIFVGGLNQALAREGQDWDTNSACDGKATPVGDLPGCQAQLIAQLRAANPNTPIVLVVMSGSPHIIPATEGIVNAVILAGYAGSLGGQAIAEAMFGKFSPGGRLPYTVPASLSDLPPLSDVHMTLAPGRTYRYYSGAYIHPFGYGLSYSTFNYAGVTLSSPTVTPCRPLTVNVTLTNAGSATWQSDADEVTQVYVKFPSPLPAGFIAPAVALRQFTRTTVPVGVSTVVSLTLAPESFALVDGDGYRQVIPGTYTLFVGGQQPGQSGPGKSGGQEPLTATVTVQAEGPTPFLNCPGATR